MQLRRVFLIAATFLAIGGVAEATPLLLGSTIQTTYLYPNTSTPYSGPSNSVVGAGVELSGFASFVDIDFSDTNILITTTRGGGPNAVAFDGLKFFDILGLIPGWTATLNVAGTTYSGFGAGQLTFDSDNIFVNVAGLTGLQGQTISIDLAPEVTTSATVPEPASLLLLGTGGLGLLALRRRKLQS